MHLSDSVKADSGLDHGLDYGLEYGLLIFKLLATVWLLIFEGDLFSLFSRVHS